MGEIEKVVGKTKHGGPRPHSGRKKGTPNKKTAAVIAGVEQSGITPLQFMLEIMRSGEKPDEGADLALKVAFYSLRFEAAKAAAPYVHPKLSAIEHTGKDGGPMDMHWTVEFVRP